MKRCIYKSVGTQYFVNDCLHGILVDLNEEEIEMVDNCMDEFRRVQSILAFKFAEETDYGVH